MRAFSLSLLTLLVAAAVFADDAALRQDRVDRAAHRAATASRIRTDVVAQSRADYWLIIGAAGSVAGNFGTFFKSDLMISNHRNVPQAVDLSFFAQGQNGASGFALKRYTIEANGALYLDDVVAKLGKSGLGTLDIRARTSAGSLDTDAKIDAFSRIWTPQANTAGTQFAGGTTSQSFPSTMIDTIQGTGRAYLLGLQQDSRFRTNIGIFNDDTTNAHTFAVQVLGISGQTTFTITVPAWSMVQQSLPAGNWGNLYLVVTPDSGMTGQWWSVYASSSDNITGDGWVTVGSQND